MRIVLPDVRDVQNPDIELADLPTATLAFALGVCCASPQRPPIVGRVAGLVEELKRRESETLWDSAYDEMVAGLNPALKATLALLVLADRGARWAQNIKHASRR